LVLDCHYWYKQTLAGIQKSGERMDTFNFTQKKFLTLSKESQHRHIIKWLTNVYQTMTTNRLNQKSLDLFSRQYNQILEWGQLQPFEKPEYNQPRLWLEKISDQIHSHRAAIGVSCRDQDLMGRVLTEDISSKPNTIDCHVALESLRSLFNVGSIIRTCEAAGFKSIILGNMPDANHPGIQKTAMGADKSIQIENTEDLSHTLIEKKKAGYKIIGIETIKNAICFDEVDWQDQTIMVFGNEEYGISSHLMEVCDQFVHIPMYGKKNSINVANAVSVICFQAAQSLAKKRAWQDE